MNVWAGLQGTGRGGWVQRKGRPSLTGVWARLWGPASMGRCLSIEMDGIDRTKTGDTEEVAGSSKKE